MPTPRRKEYQKRDEFYPMSADRLNKTQCEEIIANGGVIPNDHFGRKEGAFIIENAEWRGTEKPAPKVAPGYILVWQKPRNRNMDAPKVPHVQRRPAGLVKFVF